MLIVTDFLLLLTGCYPTSDLLQFRLANTLTLIKSSTLSMGNAAFGQFDYEKTRWRQSTFITKIYQYLRRWFDNSSGRKFFNMLMKFTTGIEFSS